MNEEGLIMIYTEYSNAISTLYIRSSEKGITNISFTKDAIQPTDVLQPYADATNKYIKTAVSWLNAYFSKNIDNNGMVQSPLPTFDIVASPTRDAMQTVSWGNLSYYGQLITEKHAQAVGQACRNNPIVILFPCHRIISKDESNIYQYMGQQNNPIKHKLFEHEGICVAKKYP